jgi:tetrameric-type glycyl-tRNA synthetase beta subunit
MPERPTPARLLLEVGCEELPPWSLAAVMEQLAADAAEALRAARLEAGQPQTTGTLRRLVLTVDRVAPRQADRVTLARGPAARVAYDSDGRPTPAALGFARAQGVPVEVLQVREMDGGRYLVAEVREIGRPAEEVLAQVLPGIVTGLTFPKTMRWKAGGMRFGRPIRWVVALLGSRVIPLQVAGVRAGRRTYGHRFLAPRAVRLRSADAYLPAMRDGHVMLGYAERRARISEAAAQLATEAGGAPVTDETLLEELAWSTEHPTPVLGAFDRALAEALPEEVVLMTLQHHQKSFGVRDPSSGRLLPAFIAVRDGGTSHLSTVRVGHEWVVRARLDDARFFLEEDRRGNFDEWGRALSRLAHVEGLGSMADHVGRIEHLSAWLAQAVELPLDDRRTLARAAHLCKADLVTAMVREFPALQGAVGRIYALAAGEAGGVATAIEEHYRPRSAGDALPATLPGALLAAADRAVLLAGGFLAGLEPSGSQDPYGLRRAASGLVLILSRHRLTVPLGRLFEAAAGLFDRPADARALAARACAEFALQRLRSILLDQGIAYDTIDAVVVEPRGDVADLEARALALHATRGRGALARLATGFARASRILKQGEPSSAVDVTLLTAGAEADLYQAWRTVREDVEAAAGAGRYADALRLLERLATPIDRFFDDVLVMAPDAAVRANRLALLREVTATFLRVADFGRLAG